MKKSLYSTEVFSPSQFWNRFWIPAIHHKVWFTPQWLMWSISFFPMKSCAIIINIFDGSVTILTVLRHTWARVKKILRIFLHYYVLNFTEKKWSLNNFVVLPQTRNRTNKKCPCYYNIFNLSLSCLYAPLKLIHGLTHTQNWRCQEFD